MSRPVWTAWLPVVIGVIVASFLAATGLGQWRMRAVDGAVLELATTTVPGIEHLAAARGENRNLRALLRERVAFAERGTHDRDELDGSFHALVTSIDEYLVLPVAPGEQELWRDLLRAKHVLHQEIGRLGSQVDRGDFTAARNGLSAEVASASTALEGALTRAITFNTGRSHRLSAEIERLRGATLYATVALDSVCTLIAIAGAALLHRMARSHQALADRHRVVQEARVDELDRFAGRIAHDILSPLGTAMFALDLAARTDDPGDRARLARRGVSAIERIQRLVKGLLDFARAGAPTDPDARTDVGDVVADLVAELRATAAARSTTLVVEQEEAVLVACDAGVLTSLIANLARNALKYIGDGPDRRVTIRVAARRGVVRIEVEDTGPGLPADVAAHVFDPYVRSRAATQPGIGLGLATVKRLAEAHGGRVGVESVAGQGCTFWFELPRVSSPPSETDGDLAVAGTS